MKTQKKKKVLQLSPKADRVPLVLILVCSRKVKLAVVIETASLFDSLEELPRRAGH